MNPGVWLAAVVFLVIGTLAYTGRWKGWIAVRRGFGTYIGFSFLFLGLALGFASAAVTFTPGSPSTGFVVLSTLAALSLLLALMGFWWMPRFL